MAHPFETDNTITVGASPEEVWDAITTGPGVDSWFMGRNEVEPRVGGAARTVLPGFTMESTVTAWDPPNRFSHRGSEGEDGSLHASTGSSRGAAQAAPWFGGSITVSSGATGRRNMTR